MFIKFFLWFRKVTKNFELLKINLFFKEEMLLLTIWNVFKNSGIIKKLLLFL